MIKLNSIKQNLLSKGLLLLLIPFLIFTTSCNEEDSDMDEMEDDMEVESTILELAQNTDDLSILASAVGNYDDLVAALGDEDASLTVFAPTNNAFTTLLDVLGYAGLDEIPADLLKQVLQYHVVGSAALSTDLSDGQSLGTLLEGESVTVSINGSTVMINMSAVATADVEASNGVVHIIDAVLVPSFVPVSDIVELAVATDDLSILVQALTKFDDLVEALSNNSGEFTVFAPTNAAFADLLGIVGQEELDDIPEAVLRRVLEYHVIAGTSALSTDLTDNQQIPTLLTDESVTVSIGSAVMIDNASVTTADISAVNGVVHIVDAVLVPSLEASIVNTVVEPAYFSTDFTILTAAVVKAELLSTLIDGDAEFTVFAPTNDAFEAAGITSLDDYTAEQLADILLYHVLDFEANEAAVAALGTGSAVPALGGNSYLSINSNGIFLNGISQVVATDVEADNGVVHVIDQTLVPPTSNIVEIAVAASQATDAEFSQLVAALTAVENDATLPNLITILSDADAAFTVFAPTDVAFQTLYDEAGDQDDDGDADITDLVTFVGGLDVIANVLQYHVVSGRVFSTDIPNVLDGQSSVAVSTVLTDAAFTLNSDLTIEGADAALSVGLDAAAIVGTNVLGTNGVIHTIDQVILP